MLKIGEFSKLSLTTAKALRFYEKEGLLTPASVDEWTGYRFYETAQLETAAKIKFEILICRSLRMQSNHSVRRRRKRLLWRL